MALRRKRDSDLRGHSCVIQTNRWRPLPWILDPWWLGNENNSQQAHLKLILKECGNQGNLLQVRFHYFWADLFMISKRRRCQESFLTYAPDSPAIRKVSWQMFVCNVPIQPDAALLMSINTGTLYSAHQHNQVKVSQRKAVSAKLHSGTITVTGTEQNWMNQPEVDVKLCGKSNPFFKTIFLCHVAFTHRSQWLCYSRLKPSLLILHLFF